MDVDKVLNCSLFDEKKQEELFKFLHACIDEICIRKGPTFHQFKNINLTEEEFNNTHKYILTLFHNPMCLYIEEEKMPAEYNQLPKHAQEAIMICLRTRKSQLTDILILEYSSKYVPTLKTYDWRLKYVIGSSKMASIKEPLLQLDLMLINKKKEETLALELNEEELDILINTLDTVNS